MEVSNWLVSWVITYLRDLQPTFMGVIMNLLSTMDIPVLLGSLTVRPWKVTETQKERIVFQPGVFNGKLLNFGGVYYPIT